LDGKTDREIASLLRKLRPPVHVTHQAIARFRARHADELTKREEQVAERVIEVALTRKEERLRELQGVYDRYKVVLDERGPEAREPKWLTVYVASKEPPTDADGNALPAKRDEHGMYLVNGGQVLVQVAKVDKALADVLTGIIEQVADELGELPKRLDPPPPAPEERVNEFRTLVLGDSAVRELAQQLFAALAVGTRDASGAGVVRERGRLDPGATPDAGQ
jgi:hypothetical protein